MSRSLPSLNAVRMFEAAARNQSFTKAAGELHVTQGAVSRQIGLLEQQVGCALFIRRGPNLELTQAGSDYFSVVRDSLDLLRRGTAQLKRRAQTNLLTISLVPSFARLWLLPRMGQVEKLLPGVSIRLAASYHLVDFTGDSDIDVAIRFGKGNWPEIFSYQFTNDIMLPVCAPDVAKKIKSLKDIQKHSMIADYPLKFNEWPQWFQSKGLHYEVQPGWQYDDVALQIEAAIEGRGVLLVRESLVRSSLRAGSLIQLFDSDFRSQFQYHFVCPEDRLKEPLINSFYQWIKSAV